MREHQSASDAAGQAGLAHVATASFVASRVVPTGGYAVALAGGAALARAAQVAGARVGYGASIAAMLQAIAVLGPSRLSVPLTQSLSAPLLGRMHARGAGLATQFWACAAIRATDQALLTVFYIAIIAGGVDAYAATYDAIAGRIPGVPDGTAAAIVATVLALVVWTAFASVVQVLVYRGALRGWPARAGAIEGPAAGADSGADTAAGDPRGGAAPPPRRPRFDPRAGAAPPPPRPRFDPRAVALAAVVAFCVLVATTAWPVLAAVAVWLALAWAAARADPAPLRSGLALAALLAGGALVFGLVGGAGLDLTLRRTVRAALLVLVATWLRAAAREDGLREVGRRSLHVARRLPATGEASQILDRLGAAGTLGASGRALAEDLRDVPRRPTPVAAAILRWVAGESDRFEHAPPPALAPEGLRTAWRDRVLVAGVIAAVAGAVMAA